jgi:hypothetical protein
MGPAVAMGGGDGGAIVMRWWIWVVGFDDLRGLVYGV